MDIFRYILIPILGITIGIISLFTDTKDIKTINDLVKSKNTLILIILILVSSVFNNAYDFFKSNDDNRNLLEQQERLERLIASTECIQESISLLPSVGMINIESKDMKSILQAIAANDALKNIELKGVYNNPVNVEYFPKGVDGDIVINELQKRGYNVSKKESILSNKPTNAIYYGSDIAFEQVKALSYILIRAGIKIYCIKPFLNSMNRTNVIQVVYSSDCVHEEPLSIDIIESMN